MYGEIQTVDELEEFLNHQIDVYFAMIADFDAKRAEDVIHGELGNMARWLHWNAVSLIGASTEALEAQTVLAGIESIRDANDEDLPDSAIIASVRHEVFREAVGQKPKVDSRGTLVSGNLAEDHKHAFYCELLQKLTDDS